MGPGRGRKALLRDDQLFSDEGEVELLLLAGALNGEQDLGAGPAAEAAFDEVLEVAPPGRLAVDVGNDVADPDPRQMGRAAGHQLPDRDLAVGQRDAVDRTVFAMAAENYIPSDLPGQIFVGVR